MTNSPDSQKGMQSQLSILHVIAEMDPRKGGVGQAVRTMVESLSDEGVKNEIVSLDAPQAAFLAKEDSLIHAKGPGLGPWKISSELKKWLNQNTGRFDIVIIHGLWLYNSYAARKAWIAHAKADQDRNKPKPQLFVMPHGMLDPYFQKAKGRKIKALRNWLFWKLVEGSTVNQADGLLFTCMTELELARQPFRPYHPKQEIVVGLGVEQPPAFTPHMHLAFRQKCPGIGQKPFLLFLSRIDQKKGVDVLINAYQHAKQQHPDIPDLVIAGPGLETEYGQHIRSLVSEEGLIEQVHFPGMLSGDAKWGAFYGCQAFILPSHQENFGIAVVEALACEKAVLVSNQVNIWQEIVSGSGGLVNDDSVEGCQQLLKDWTSMTEQEKKQMCEAALLCYQKNYAVKPAAKRLLEAISR